MSTYYYLDDPKSEEGTTPVHEDDMIAALFAIAKKHGVIITHQMILDHIYKNSKNYINKGETPGSLRKSTKTLSVKKIIT